MLVLALGLVPESMSYTIHDRFALNGEANVPAWYSAVLLFSACLAAAVVSLRSPTSASRACWLVLAGTYAFLSLDEGACLHEFLEKTMAAKWAYFYAPFAAVFVAFCLWHLWRHACPRTRRWILTGLVASAAGGIGLELVSHAFDPLPDAVQLAEFAAEEGLEMVGTIMVLTGCLHQLNWLDQQPTATNS
jgi:hypothetical protein